MEECPAMDETKPHFDENGDLIIPFECSDHAYKYWKQEGKSLPKILAELHTDPETWARYTHEPYPEADDGDTGDGESEG